MTDFALPLISLAAGAALGLVSSLILYSARQRQEIILRLLDQYLSVRKEVVEAVSELTHLESYRKLTDEEIRAYRDASAKLFYKHFDFLPKPVLDSLLLLHVVLSNPGGHLYSLKGDCIVELTNEEVPEFISQCCAYRNAALVAPLALQSEDPTVRTNHSIKLHARYVLYTLNRYASLEEIGSLTREFKKVASA